ncbi:MAG: ABC transporter permease [Chloroflexi bacterium]|nr:ABC transporter permease [Chloroflexota bacterium]
MRKFLAQRFVFAIMSLVAATLIVFVLSRMAGDPLLLYAKPGGYGMSEEQIAALSEKLGLDRPLIVQYFIWLGRVVTGDFGVTLLAERDVRTVVFEKLGATIQLGIAAFILATLIGIPLGVVSAIARGTVWDYFGRTFALLGQATPSFFMGIVGILIFAVTLDWLPPGGRPVDQPFWPHQVEALALPMITLGLLPAASYLRLTRSSMLEVLDSEFVKLARAKGVDINSVIWKHAFRNALIPPITVSALILIGFLEGSVIVESVFAWPGVGRLAVDSIHNNDFPLLTGVIFMFAILYVAGSFLADMLYLFVDPRIRYD